VFGAQKGKIGKVFVKYAEPINLTDYMRKFDDKNLDHAALQLTKDLYQIQQREQPITMNSLISTSLFYHPASEVTFGTVKLETSLLYNYIQDK
jgi:glycerol-3-phosphate O-acyltransferase